MAPSFPAPAELLPHRPPMLLLRAVLAHQEVETVCEASFDRSFAADCGGTVPASFGLELIAQAAAVHHGLRQRTEGQPTPAATRGLLLGSRRLQLGVRHLPVEQSLRVVVTDGGQGSSGGGMVRFEGRVQTWTGQILASGDATVLEWREEGPPLA